MLSTITYRRQNLVADPFPAGTFDLILCRYVLFNLHPAARERVLEGLARALTADGDPPPGAGETVIGQSSLLRPSRRARPLRTRRHALTGAAARDRRRRLLVLHHLPDLVLQPPVGGRAPGA
ncbi:CheR family methyltransferase [Sphingomonas sp. MMS24-JH45]